MNDQFLTTEEVAYILNVSVQTVIKLIKCKKLNAVKLSRTYRIPYSSIEEFKMKGIVTK